MRPVGPSRREIGWAFLLCVAYVVLAVGLRLLTGPAMEVDEAEVWLHYQQGYAMGYGPQFPLYYWLQFALFDLFGQSLLTITLLRAGLMAATVAFAYLALRQMMPAQIAGLAALSIALLLDYSWVSQYTLTHSRIMAVAAMATFAAFVWFLQTGRLAAILWLGLSLGLGGLTKPNYWIVPVMFLLAALSIPAYRRVLKDWRLVLAPLIAALCLVVPYAWIVNNPELALASVHKFGLAIEGARLIVTAIGFFDLSRSAFYSLTLFGFAVVIFMSLGRERVMENADAMRLPVQFLRRIAVVGVVLSILIVLLVGGGRFKIHWLMFLTPFIAFAVIVPVLARMPKAVRPFWGGLCVAAILVTQVALATFRITAPDPSATDVERVAQVLTERFGAEDRTLLADYFWAGNLKRARPDWPVDPYLLTRETSGPTLLVTRLEISDAELGRFPLEGWTISNSEVFQTPYVRGVEDVRGGEGYVAYHVRMLDPPG